MMADPLKRVLVTGGAGFLGSHLCERLIADGCYVYCLDNVSTGSTANIRTLRRHPRFVRWRGTWDHKITCRRSPAANAADIPSALWSPTWVLHRLDAERCVGVTGDEPNRRVLLRETLDEWLLRRSAPGFPATVLGL